MDLTIRVGHSHHDDDVLHHVHGSVLLHHVHRDHHAHAHHVPRVHVDPLIKLLYLNDPLMKVCDHLF